MSFLFFHFFNPIICFYIRNISCRSIFDDSCNFFFHRWIVQSKSNQRTARTERVCPRDLCCAHARKSVWKLKKKNIFFCMSVILFAFKNFYKYTCYILKPQWTTSIKTGRRRTKNLNVLGITSPLAIRKIHISFPIAKIENAS